jgi:valyl-tRNA synthetase
MSKSKGNVIDPLIMMEKYGTDAFRFTLAAFAAQGRDVRFSEERVEGYRHFVNKLWNASRFILLNAEGTVLPETVEEGRLDLGGRWIVSRLSGTAAEVERSLTEYRFNDAANGVYQFVWHELCDWYIEMVKPVLYDEAADREPVRKCLLFVLERTLRLLHPFMPYVTEEIWQHIPKGGSGGSIVVAPFPAGLARNEAAEGEMAVLMEAVAGIRTIRGELNLSPSVEVKAHVKTLSAKAKDVLQRDLLYLKKLARADVIELGADVRKPKGSAAAVRDALEVYVPLEGLLNIGVEIDRLNREETKIRETIDFLNRKLMNEDFLKRAPRDVVSKEREKYDDCLRKVERIREHIKKLHEAGEQDNDQGRD